jgi:hypothetical protein
MTTIKQFCVTHRWGRRPELETKSGQGRLVIWCCQECVAVRVAQTPEGGDTIETVVDNETGR